jgi:hypothetical protein
MTAMLTLAVTLALATAQAAAAGAPPARAERLKQVQTSPELLTRLRALLPNTTIERVSKTDVPGLWRVEMGEGKVAYIDATGRYLVLGLVIDLHTGRSLDDALEGAASADVNSKE